MTSSTLSTPTEWQNTSVKLFLVDIPSKNLSQEVTQPLFFCVYTYRTLRARIVITNNKFVEPLSI
jgi:hypothetical protein